MPRSWTWLRLLIATRSTLTHGDFTGQNILINLQAAEEDQSRLLGIKIIDLSEGKIGTARSRELDVNFVQNIAIELVRKNLSEKQKGNQMNWSRKENDFIQCFAGPERDASDITLFRQCAQKVLSERDQEIIRVFNQRASEIAHKHGKTVTDAEFREAFDKIRPEDS
jgi:hypothetical protein